MSRVRGDRRIFRPLAAPALMLWGRHDIFFDLDETLSWMKALRRMEAHVLDGPHFLLETHSADCAALMSAFVRRVEGMHLDLVQKELSSRMRRLVPPNKRLEQTATS